MIVLLSDTAGNGPKRILLLPRKRLWFPIQDLKSHADHNLNVCGNYGPSCVSWIRFLFSWFNLWFNKPSYGILFAIYALPLSDKCIIEINGSIIGFLCSKNWMCVHHGAVFFGDYIYQSNLWPRTVTRSFVLESVWFRQL